MNKSLYLLRLLLISFVSFAYAKAETVNLKVGESCASVCSGKDKIFKFEEDKIYVYNFLSKHSIKNPNSEQETLTLELKGNAEIFKLAACDFSLRLSNVNLKEYLTGKDGMMQEYSMMKTLLEKTTLRFGFDDGKVTGVCQDKNDNEFAVNVKKAIISGLQVSMDNLDIPNYLTETDISGDCLTEYTTKPEPPNFVIVKKIKSSSGCARKNKYFSSISGKVFEQPMENRHVALLDGSYTCDLKIKRSEGLKESVCTETQTFKSYFSNKEGSSIEIKQELKFDSSKSGKIEAQVPYTRSDLTMNHGDKDPLFKRMKETPLVEIGKKLCETIQQSSVSVERTRLFIKLIRSLSKADFKGIQELSQYFNDKCSSNKEKLNALLLDALPYVKTDDAFKYLIEDSDVYQFQKLSFSVLENASPSMIGLFTKKLNSSKTENSALLTLSSMIKSYCDKNSGCTLNPEVITAMNFLTENLGTKCYFADKKALEKALLSLRAIGNAGNFPDYKKLVKILESCVDSIFNEEDTKIYAIEALQQFPCQADVDNFLWKIYDDISYSSEIRIQAYLSLVRCPMRETFRKVIQKLNTESSQQLGSFIWSHITNLMETSDRFKTDLRDQLQIFTKPMSMLARKFNLDFRSYSKNIEKTFQRGYSAVKFDTNIIFSNSPIPSLVKSNITVDIFGRSVNILELGIRARGVSERLFGSRTAKPHESPHADIIKMDRKNKNKLGDTYLTVYSKIMGHEIFFNPNILNDIFMALEKPYKKSFDKSFLLLDTVISVSSITGFPVQLAIKSAVSAELQLSKNQLNKYDDIELLTKNNVGIQIVGKLQVNAHCAKIGVQSSGSAATDMEFGGKLKLINGQKQENENILTDYQLELNKMPDNKKLLSFSNELSLIHNLKKDETKPQYKVLLDKCTGDTMFQLRGIKICGSVSMAPKYQAYFPNIKAELTAKSFNGFKLRFRKENAMKPISKLVNLLIQTSFQGGDKDTIKYEFKRDLVNKIQTYEVSIWDKDIYFKLDIEKEKVSGKVKYGKNEGSLTGAIQTKGIFSSTIDMNVKTENDEIILVFKQTFDKGLTIHLSGYNKKDKSFNVQSKTSMTITTHKLFNKFERFRHETNLKIPGENEFSLVLESSKGNEPTMEKKGKIETYWKTKSKNNFLIKQNYLWSKYSVEDQSVSSDKIPGTNYTINLDQQIEVKDKKFNLQHSLNYFISNNFFVFGTTPSLVALKLETFDVVKNVFIRQIDTKLLLDIMNNGKGKIYLKNFIKSALLNFKQDLIANAEWKRNSLDMYDLNAEITESDLLKVLLKHQFTTTQNGVSSIEINVNKLVYKVNSELMLPKSHTLTISWPESSLVIESKVDAKSVAPFHTVVMHDIKMGEKLLATITNTAKYDNQKGMFSFESMGKGNEKEIYSIYFGSELKYEFTSTSAFYDSVINFKGKIPSNDIDFAMDSKQYIRIKLDGQINIEGKNFDSKFVYTNKKSKLMYGWGVSSEKVIKNDPHFLGQLTVYKGSSTDSVVIKLGRENQKYLFGLAWKSEKNFEFEFLYKISMEPGKVTTSSFFVLNWKDNSMYNMYYKNNAIFLSDPMKLYSLSWNGEYKMFALTVNTPFQGSIKYVGSGLNKFDILFDLSHPFLSLTTLLHKVTIGFTFEIGKQYDNKGTIASNFLIKWQESEKRTSNYYDLKLNGNYDFNTADVVYNFEVLLTKDSSLTKLLELTAAMKGNPKTLESSIKFKYDKKNATLTLNWNFNDPKMYSFLFSIQSSAMTLKELSMMWEMKNQGRIYQGKSSFTLVSENSYNMEITQVRKIDMTNGLDWVSNVKWVSNLRYLNSGSYVFGVLLSKNNDFKINFSAFYKNAKKINLKFSIDTKSYEVQAFAESFIIVPLKFSLVISKPSPNTITLNSEVGYNDKYLKLSDAKFVWKNEASMKSSEFALTILSSNDAFSDLSISVETSCETDKIFSTFKTNSLIKYKEKSVQVCKIDLTTGEIKFESRFGQYFKNCRIQNLELEIKYKYESIRDMMIEYSFLAAPVVDKSSFKLVYYRKEPEAPSRTFKSLGKAFFYNKIEFFYKENNIKLNTFIDESMKTGTLHSQILMPLYSIDVKEINLNIEVKKESDSVYTGTITKDKTKYQFKFQTNGIWKKMLEMEGISDAYFKKVSMEYDFTKNSVLKINADKKFNFEASMKSESAEKKSGTVVLLLSGKEILNLEIKAETKVPKDITTISDYIKAIFGIKKGLYMARNVTGKVYGKYFSRSAKLFHQDSEKFPGGTHSFFSAYTIYNSDKAYMYKILLSYDRNEPMFDFEESIYYMVDDEKKVDYVGRLTYKSVEDFFINLKSDYGGVSKFDFLGLCSPNIAQSSFSVEMASNTLFGFGFKYLKNEKDFAIHFASSKNNYTMNTNLGSIIGKKDNYFPVGVGYFLEFSNNYGIKIFRKEDLEYVITLNGNWPKPLTMNVKVNYDPGKPEKSLIITGSSSFENMKEFVHKLQWKLKKAENVHVFTVTSRVNRKLLCDLKLKYLSKNKYDQQLEVDYEGNYKIKASATFNTDSYRFDHSIIVKDGTFKTELWSSTSKCSTISKMDCYLSYKNQVREIVLGSNWNRDSKRVEITWHKSKGQGLVFFNKREGDKMIMVFENPIRKVKLTYSMAETDEKRSRSFRLDITGIEKSSSNDIFVHLQYTIEGSLKSDYQLNANLKTSLMQKEMKLTIKRDVSVDIGDLYALDLKASFDGEKLPFFGLNGYLRQLSSRSYELKLHSTSYEKFATLTLTSIFASEELTLEYKLVQSDQPTNEFLFQFIPFRKVHITNKKNLKILISRDVYQYGYRSDYVFKMGSKGVDIVAYAIYSKSPLKYYMEFKNGEEKIVIHVRAVGDNILGEMYRKTPDKKILDAQLKINTNDKNILSNKLYWDPKMFDRMKESYGSIFKPDNMKTFTVQLYDTSENQLSAFMSGIKTNIIKNMNVQVSLDFMKGIANDWERLPKSLTLSYENDDYYLKSVMAALSNCFTKIDLSVRLYRFQISIGEIKDVISSKLYDWFIDARMYGAIYQPVKDTLYAISYDDIKSCIMKIVNVGKFAFNIYKTAVERIADVLDVISKKVEASVQISTNIKDAVISFYKNSMIGNIVSMLSDIKNDITTTIGEMMKSDIFRQRIQYYEDALKNSEEIIGLIQNFKNKILEFFQTSDLVSNIIQTIKLIRSMKYKEAFINLVRLNDTKFSMDLDEASIELQLYVPPVSKTYLGIVKTLSNWVSLKALYKMNERSLAEKLLELFYRYEYLMFNYGSLSFESFKKIFPPYAKSSWVIKGTSLITFDNNAVKIGSGKCSYLLARDFKKKSFSLVMEIGSDPNDKTFTLYDIDIIQISQKGWVKRNKKVLESFPVLIKTKNDDRNIIIHSDSDTIRIRTSEGLVIKYFKNFDALKVMVVGNWHGFVSGLLGSNDFDKINDWATPTGRITHDAGILSTSWSIDKCDGKTKTGLHAIRTDPSQTQSCVNLFSPESSSYLRRCHSLINPDPYLDLCLKSLQYGEKSKDEFKELLCSLSRNYVIRCKYQGIMIRLDKTCVKCGQYKLNSKISTNRLDQKKKFNFIFIMEQSVHLLPYQKFIENIVDMMALNEANIFTLLSYNGRGAFRDIHFKSVAQSVSTNGKLIKMTLKNHWSAEELSNITKNQKTDQPGKGIYDAIKMSSVPGFTEKIILVGNSPCSENQKYIYSLLAGLLNNAGISVTYLTTQALTGTSADDNTVGLGNKLVYYFEENSNDLKSRQWKKYVQAPKDACSPLARLQKGFVWSLKPLTTDMRMRRVAETIFNELDKVKQNSFQTCSCAAGNFDDGRVECKASKATRLF